MWALCPRLAAMGEPIGGCLCCGALLVEPLIGLRLVFQTEVPADLLGRIERVDVSRLETGRVAVRVPADDHRSPFPAFSRWWPVLRVLH